jgi:hypothetical protein
MRRGALLTYGRFIKPLAELKLLCDKKRGAVDVWQVC